MDSQNLNKCLKITIAGFGGESNMETLHNLVERLKNPQHILVLKNRESLKCRESQCFNLLSTFEENTN